LNGSAGDRLAHRVRHIPCHSAPYIRATPPCTLSIILLTVNDVGY
jgi:hypothetical protein